ncbi:hypothetical protein J3A83DRAFT_4373295 [Scleroderma citrinum]
MSTPAERAARRKAILSRGSDRLAKLTTSARGEEATTYIQTDMPVRSAASGLGAFTSEETPSPPSLPITAESSRGSPPPPFTARGQPDPSTWTEEHQRQFMQALMGTTSPSPFTLPHPPADDPLATMMAQLAQTNQGPGVAAGKAPASATPPQPPSLLQKLLPLLHMVCMWILLAFFVFWKEPQVYAEKTGNDEVSIWQRWRTLALRRPDEAGWWGVQLAPFFWTFMTLQIMLHSFRIFSGHAHVQPPKLLAFALPHLPPPLRSSITNGLQYLQLAGVFLDDIAAIVFGIGVVVLIASWLAT